jgi:hypothetical protein
MSLVFCVWARESAQGAGVYGLIAAWKGAGGTCMYVWVYRFMGMYRGSSVEY